MNPIIKEHFVSAVKTFVSTFVMILGASIATSPEIMWTGAFWWALILVAIRGAVAEVWNRFMPVKLGGRA